MEGRNLDRCLWDSKKGEGTVTGPMEKRDEEISIGRCTFVNYSDYLS
jgi:hypothetical protein